MRRVFHLVIKQSTGVTVWGITIDTPASARNTDGIGPISSSDITVAHSFIRTGDDNIAIKAGSGGPARHLSILSNHLYAGHGMSVGSETMGGVSDVLIKDLTLDGATSGLRIKSDPSRRGRVERVDYQNICLRHNRRPVDIDSMMTTIQPAEYTAARISTIQSHSKTHCNASGTIYLFNPRFPLPCYFMLLYRLTGITNNQEQVYPKSFQG